MLIKNLQSKITKPIKIIFCEQENNDLMTAIKIATKNKIINPIFVNNLEEAVKAVKNGDADSMVAGIDYSSRDVIVATRDFIGIENEIFSSSFIMEMPDGRIIVLADCATNKNPSARQLADIVVQTAEMAKLVLSIKPKVAMLSFSTLGSGGKDDSITKIHEAIDIVRENNPKIEVDGELQLDSAINPAVASKKAPNSTVAGQANILITPDLNSGNILYKSIEQFAGAKAYGPILQGFKSPVSDLSRGSTVDDIYGSIIITAVRAQSL